MAKWDHRVAIRHLYTHREDWESIQASMTAIAEVLERKWFFSDFDTSKFRSIPFGDEVFGPSDYANRLLDMMYNYADDRRIWIELASPVITQGGR